MLEKQQSPLAKFIEDHANRSNKSYEEIATLCGFKNDAPIHAFTRGDMRLPLDMVSPLAETIGCDGDRLFVLALKEWFSEETFHQMARAFLAHPAVDSRELEWLKVIRAIFDGEVPEMTDRIKRRLQGVLKSV